MIEVKQGVHPVKWLRDHGWVQGTVVDSGGKVCLGGAMSNTTGEPCYCGNPKCGNAISHSGRIVTKEEEDAVLHALNELTGRTWPSIPSYNDNFHSEYQIVEDALVKVYGDPL